MVRPGVGNWHGWHARDWALGRAAEPEEQERPVAIAALRIGLLSGAAVCLLGVADQFLSFLLLTATVGPTAYVFAAHPHTEASRLRNALFGHSIAVGFGLLSLLIFGLWNAPSTVVIGHATLAQAGACGVAIAGTLGLLHILHAHHAQLRPQRCW